MVTRVFIECPSLWLQEGHLRGKKKLLGALVILVISSVFHELWFILALREHLTAECHKNTTYLSCEGGLCCRGSDISCAAEAADVQNWYMPY